MYSSQSYIEIPKDGEIITIATYQGNARSLVYTGTSWALKSGKIAPTNIKVDKDDANAKRHYVKTLIENGRGIKMWECGLCGKEFRFQYALMRHIPTHTDVKNYECDSCPKAFSHLTTLTQHKATHLNMRPFVCDFCQKSFNRISSLISHKKIHSEDKRHICPYCNKGFHQKGNLRNHMYTHTNERPFKCEICQTGFKQKSNLVCHKASAHANRKCKSTFTEQSACIDHMQACNNALIQFNNAKEQIEKKSLSYKCTLVDDSNNIVCHLPITVDLKPGPSSMPQLNQKNNENDILTIIKHEPTEAMVELHDQGKSSFVLLYQAGQSEPKICMAVIKTGEYALVNPSKTVISNYNIERANNNMHSRTPPIVSTVIQEIDSSGKIKTKIQPAGLGFEVVESYEGANGINAYEYYASADVTRPCLSDWTSREEHEREIKIQKNKSKSILYTQAQPGGQRTKNEISNITPQIVSPEEPLFVDVVGTAEPYKDSEHSIEIFYVGNPNEKSKTEPIYDNMRNNFDQPVVCETVPKVENNVESLSYADFDDCFINDVFNSVDVCPETPLMPIETIPTIPPNNGNDSLANIETGIIPFESQKEPYSDFTGFDCGFDPFDSTADNLIGSQANSYHLPDTSIDSTYTDLPTIEEVEEWLKTFDDSKSA